jgi:hypothetical protein
VNTASLDTTSEGLDRDSGRNHALSKFPFINKYTIMCTGIVSNYCQFTYLSDAKTYYRAVSDEKIRVQHISVTHANEYLSIIQVLSDNSGQTTVAHLQDIGVLPHKLRLEWFVHTLLRKEAGLPLYIMFPPPGIDVAGTYSKLSEYTVLGVKTDEVLIRMSHDQGALGSCSLEAEKVKTIKMILAQSDQTTSKYTVALLSSLFGEDVVEMHTKWHKDAIQRAVSDTFSGIEDRVRLRDESYRMQCAIARTEPGSDGTLSSQFRMAVDRRVTNALSLMKISSKKIEAAALDKPLEDDASAFIDDQFIRPSEFETRPVYDESVGISEDYPLKYLLVTKEKVWEAYELEHPTGLKRSHFLSLFTAQYQPLPLRTCLCNACADGRECLTNLRETCGGAAVAKYCICTTEEAVAACVELKTSLLQLLPKVKLVVSSGGLLTDDSLKVPGSLWDLMEVRDISWDDLSDSEYDEQQELDALLGKLQAACVTYEEHIKNWGHQSVRFLQYMEARIRWRMILVIDFKEKIRTKQTATQRQRDYFGGAYMSLFNCTVYVVSSDGQIHSRYIDILDELDTHQDTYWVQAAFRILVDHLQDLILEFLVDLEEGLEEVVGWSDNGPHFHNALFVGGLLTWLKNVMAVLVNWNFFEPGEAKSICDQHFAVVSGACKRFIGTGMVVVGVDDVRRIIQNLENTVVCLNIVDRSQEPEEYMAFKMINSYKQFILKPGDDTIYCRKLTDTGDLEVLEESGVKYRVAHNKKVTSGENGADFVKMLYKHADREEADVWAHMLVHKGKLISRSESFTAAQTEKCMQFLKNIALEFPEDVRGNVKDGAKARKPHTYAAYLVSLQRESDRAWAAEHEDEDMEDGMEETVDV